jgi:hypothetical protein
MATSRSGTFRYVISPGSIPQIGPVEMADTFSGDDLHLRRAGGSVAEIICMEYSPSAEIEGGAWIVHARGSFWSNAGSNRKSTEAVVTRWEAGAGISLLQAKCDDSGDRLMKGQ